MSTILKAFLLEATNSHAREEVLSHRLSYDLKLAAAANGYHLATYYSDVDHDGFDIIADDRTNLRKLQLKTVQKGGKTKVWDVHKQLIRPTANNQEDLGFQKGNWGVEGGVVLTEYEVNIDNSINVSYYFTDIYVISSLALGLIGNRETTKKSAATFRDELRKGIGSETITTRKGMYLKTQSPDSLLALLAMQSNISLDWHSRIWALCREEWGQKGEMLPEVLQQYRTEIQNVIKTVCGNVEVDEE